MGQDLDHILGKWSTCIPTTVPSGYLTAMENQEKKWRYRSLGKSSISSRATRVDPSPPFRGQVLFPKPEKAGDATLLQPRGVGRWVVVVRACRGDGWFHEEEWQNEKPLGGPKIWYTSQIYLGYIYIYIYHIVYIVLYIYTQHNMIYGCLWRWGTSKKFKNLETIMTILRRPEATHCRLE